MPIRTQAMFCFTTCPKMIPSVMQWQRISITKNSWAVTKSKFKRIILPPYRLVYLDFGMMGHLSPSLTDGIAQVVIALNTKSARQVGQAILGICNRTGEVDEQEFYSQLTGFLAPYLNTGLGGIDLPAMLFQIISLCRQNNLQVKPEVTLLIKHSAQLKHRSRA
mgnify:CR=1 FL=1